MRVKNYRDYALNAYVSVQCPIYKLGDIVINKENEIGVIIQIHERGEYRTDMFGNCSINEIRKATTHEIETYRPNI